MPRIWFLGLQVPSMEQPQFRIAGAWLTVLFLFDGTDDYIEVPYQSSYSSNLFSFSLWVNPSANSSSYQSPFTFRGLPTGFMLYKDPSNTWSPWVGTGSNWGTSTNLGTITLNEWVFILCIYNGTVFAGYKNGSLVSTSSPSFAPNTSSPLRIGAGLRKHHSELFL